MGEVRLSSPAALSTIESVEFGTNLQSWVEAKRVSSTPLEEGGISLRLPTGLYGRQVSVDVQDDFVVKRGEIVDLR